MGGIQFLDDIALVALLGVAVTLFLSRLKMPTVAGLLLAGALGGPFGLGLVTSVSSIESLADVGVVLLLFGIGLEFSLSRILTVFRRVLVGAALQVGLTTLVAAYVATALGEPFRRGLFYGFIFSLSSTAIVLRALSERQELDAPHGRFIMGTLVLQDLCVIPMVLMIPILAESRPFFPSLVAVLAAILKAGAVVVVAIALARNVVPKILDLVDASRSREVFLLAILGLCIGTAWVTASIGLSLALGAFVAGVVVADTEYGHRAMGDILPLKDAFVSIFFVSLGMLFDVRIVIANPWPVVLSVFGFFVVKGFLASVSAMVMRFPSRVAWLSGVGLAQFGEFGFVLAKLAGDQGLVDDSTMAPLLMGGIITMFLTPILVRWAPRVTAGERLLGPLEKLIGARGIDEADERKAEWSDHVVIVGYGLAGKLLVRALLSSDVRTVVLELNAETVRAAKATGLPIYYADATSEEALMHANLPRARALVLLMNDPSAAERTLKLARRIAPEVRVLVRTRYARSRPMLKDYGAEWVVAEEVEGAVEVIARVLRWLEFPRNAIDARIHEARHDTQPTDRKSTVPRSALSQHEALKDLKVESVEVTPGSIADGHSPVDVNLRARTGALIIAVRRKNELLEHFAPTEAMQAGDVVYFVGTPAATEAALVFLSDAANR